MGRRERWPRRQSEGTHRPRLRLAVYIIISSYDYFAFCLSTGARCSVKAQKLTYYFRSKPRARTAWVTFFKLSPRRLTKRVRFTTAKLISPASVQEWKINRWLSSYSRLHEDKLGNNVVLLFNGENIQFSIRMGFDNHIRAKWTNASCKWPQSVHHRSLILA